MRSFCIAFFLCATTLAHGAEAGSSATSSVSSQPGTRIPSLKLYDAHHRIIGLLASYNGLDGVYLTINGAITFVRITRQPNASGVGVSATNYVWSPYYDVTFESADCSGQLVINYDASWPRSSAAVLEGGDVVVYVGSDTNTTPITSSSYLNGTTCIVRPATMPSVRPESSLAVSQRYPEPLTIGY
jgi:hypothetical protein